MSLLQDHGDAGHPLTRTDFQEAVEELVRRMPERRRAKLRFVKGRSGKEWLKVFGNRHRDSMRFGMASRQDAIRMQAVNGESMTTNGLPFSKLMKVYNFDAQRIFNMDEKGITAGKDATGTRRKGTYTRARMCAQQAGPIFRNCDRMTMMASVCAVGTPGPLIVVLKRTALRTKTIKG